MLCKLLFLGTKIPMGGDSKAEPVSVTAPF
jgi:hypothetical protein